jgi:hypothetical protein
LHPYQFDSHPLNRKTVLLLMNGQPMGFRRTRRQREGGSASDDEQFQMLTFNADWSQSRAFNCSMHPCSVALLPLLLSGLLVAAAPLTASEDGSWDDVGTLLQNAIHNHTFPGCVAIVASAKGTLFAKAFGTLTYDQSSPPVSRPTPFTSKVSFFKMASLADES